MSHAFLASVAYSYEPMRLRRQLGRHLLLTTLVLGLGLLGLLRHHHAAHPATRIALDHHPLPVHSHSQRSSGAGRRSGNGTVSMGDHASPVNVAHLGGGDSPQVVALVALPSSSLRFGKPAPQAFPRERNVLAQGSAARAPGSPRGPPTFSIA